MASPGRADATYLTLSFESVQVVFYAIFGDISQALGDLPTTGRRVLQKDR